MLRERRAGKVRARVVVVVGAPGSEVEEDGLRLLASPALDDGHHLALRRKVFTRRVVDQIGVAPRLAPGRGVV